LTERGISHARGRRQLERLTIFSDGVVAVAITLLVLPLIDSLSESRSEGVRKIVQDNASLLIAYFFTFAAVALMWSLHNRIFGVLRAFNVRIFLAKPVVSLVHRALAVGQRPRHLAVEHRW
jgi:uncharacterized membrane protein